MAQKTERTWEFLGLNDTVADLSKLRAMPPTTQDWYLKNYDEWAALLIEHDALPVNLVSKDVAIYLHDREHETSPICFTCTRVRPVDGGFPGMIGLGKLFKQVEALDKP